MMSYRLTISIGSSPRTYNLFIDKTTGEGVYALSPKRGNVPYAARKSHQRNALLEAIKDKEFDYPIGNSTKFRMTKILFVTFSFDRSISPERAWAMLRSKPIEGSNCPYNVISELDANLSSIFGKHGKLVCKEAQASGYPAPHMIIILDEPVKVEMKINKSGRQSWRLCDPRILRRIGKDTALRNLAFKNHRKANSLNPIWKHGFIDFEGVVKGYTFRNRKNVMSYPFKYLTKCLTEDNSDSISNYDTINEIKDTSLKTALFTHLGNKCMNTRDISFGKGFKTRVGMLPPEEAPKNSKWKRIRTVPGFVYHFVKDMTEKHNISVFREMFANKEGSDASA